MKKYRIITYGCQANRSDSERIASLLETLGYIPVNEAADDLVVINVCSVRQSAVDRAQKRLDILRSAGVKTILTGCILEKDRKKAEGIADFILDIKELPKWPKILGETKKNNLKITDYFKIPPQRQNSLSAFISIMTGCDNFCAYCVVPYTRGREQSRPFEEILKEVQAAIQGGANDIWLLGQNVNRYNSKSKTNLLIGGQKTKIINFAKLLKIINDLPEDFKLSFLTSHPKDMSTELIEIMANCQKLIKEIHLPVQSGDNQILKKMNRHYTVTNYKNLIKKIRKKIPGIKISTDVIVGFPGETKKQFENTVQLFKEIKFNKAYIAKYSPRPGTIAFKLKDNVPLQEKKRRWQILENLTNKLNRQKIKQAKLVKIKI